MCYTVPECADCVSPPSLSLSFHPYTLDCPDSAGSGGGVLPVLAAPPCRPSLGRVWELPFEPGFFFVTGGCSLPGLQQLLCQPCDLCLPVRELQEGLQAGLQVSDRHCRLPAERHQGGPQ